MVSMFINQAENIKSLKIILIALNSIFLVDEDEYIDSIKSQKRF